MNKKEILKKADKSYTAQKTRCYNSNATQYKWYGAKGIEVEYSKKEFIEWYSNKAKKFRGKTPTVGRIDHSKNYTLENIEMIDQCKNSSERIARAGPPTGKYKIIAINQKTGKIKIFDSSYEIERVLGNSVSTVHRQASGYSKKPITTWRFKYADRDINVI